MDATIGMTARIFNAFALVLFCHYLIIRLAVLHDFAFHIVSIGLSRQARAELLDQGVAADDLKIAHVVRLTNLVQVNGALRDGAGDHHAGEAGQSHLVDAVGKIDGLLDGRTVVFERRPVNHAAPGEDQHQPDGANLAHPYFKVADSLKN